METCLGSQPVESLLSHKRCDDTTETLFCHALPCVVDPESHGNLQLIFRRLLQIVRRLDEKECNSRRTQETPMKLNSGFEEYKKDRKCRKKTHTTVDHRTTSSKFPAGQHLWDGLLQYNSNNASFWGCPQCLLIISRHKEIMLFVRNKNVSPFSATLLLRTYSKQYKR